MGECALIKTCVLNHSTCQWYRSGELGKMNYKKRWSSWETCCLRASTFLFLTKTQTERLLLSEHFLTPAVSSHRQVEVIGSS